MCRILLMLTVFGLITINGLAQTSFIEGKETGEILLANALYGDIIFEYDGEPLSRDYNYPKVYTKPVEVERDWAGHDIAGRKSNHSIRLEIYLTWPGHITEVVINTYSASGHEDYCNPSNSYSHTSFLREESTGIFRYYPDQNPTQIVMCAYTPAQRPLGNAVGYIELDRYGDFTGWLSHYGGKSITAGNKTYIIEAVGYSYQTNAYLNSKIQNSATFPQKIALSYRAFSAGGGYTGFNPEMADDAVPITSNGVEIHHGDIIHGHKGDYLIGIGAKPGAQ